MNRFIYLGVFIISVLVLGAGVLFLCAAISLPERWPLALVLLGLGAAGAGWSAYAYRRWSGLQPAALAARVTNLAAENKGELGVAQIMSTLGIPAALATETLDTLVQQGQARREARDAQ